ncbi:MAG TPA: ATP-binding cassette domain-containing protein [Acetobacteraceae bacterium]|nr:ATP-binding cassette domain-containing protein [Acetobacteraceae bacterium]
MAEVMLRALVRRKLYRHPAGARVVLEGIDLVLGPKEIVALVGPSGCGKTTLLRIIAGLDRDFEGELAWRGGAPPRIGVVFQEPRLLPWRTVRRNLTLVLPTDEAGEADRLLHALGLWHVREMFPTELSLGMARRVAIARAFSIAPALLLLDEPFVSLDAASAETSRALLLTAWRQRPTAAILVTHDLTEAAMLADRILVLSTGPARIGREINVPKEIRRAGAARAEAFAANLRGGELLLPSRSSI